MQKEKKMGSSQTSLRKPDLGGFIWAFLQLWALLALWRWRKTTCSKVT